MKQKIVEDDFVLVEYSPLPSSDVHAPIDKASVSNSSKYLETISAFIDTISPVLRPINLEIHDNPELGYKEHHAHKVLTEFMSTQKGWTVTPHAYGIETAFIAVYDSGKKGPVVSFNAEYGASSCPVARRVDIHVVRMKQADTGGIQMRCLVSATLAGITS